MDAQSSSRESIRRLSFAIVFITAGVALSPFTSIPVGVVKVNPTQHFLNVLAAVTVGPLWGTFMAYAVGQLRLVLGLGTVFAFPGGMVGALFSALTWRFTGNLALTALAEVVGTGCIGTAASAWLVAPLIHSKVTFLALFPAFGLSTLAGASLALIVISTLSRSGVIRLGRKR